MLLRELENYTGQLLQSERYKDYAPNGIQVEGRSEVKRLICGVTASEALIDEAIAWGADAVLVHHGYFWKSEDPRVVGSKKRRLAKLLKHDISLLAYHLPLDAHAELGNNAQLGILFDLREHGRFGDQQLGFLGATKSHHTLGEFAALIEAKLARAPIVIGDTGREIRLVAWCTGGAQSYFADAIATGCDVYVTGEASEHNYHAAIEHGVAFIAAGHHATERYGVQALAAHLATQFGLEWRYIELANPI